MKLDSRLHIQCALPVLLVALLPATETVFASCCGGGGAQPEPASRMMGPLNKPLQVEVVNNGNGVAPVSYGGSQASVPPGTHPISFGGMGNTFAPLPGERHAFSGNQSGIKEQTCPPAPASSGAPAEATNTNPVQRHGSPSVQSNLDKA